MELVSWVDCKFTVYRIMSDGIYVSTASSLLIDGRAH